MALKFTPIGKYAPDMAAYTSPNAATTIENVLPATIKKTAEGEEYISYSPFPSMVPYSHNGLDSVCKGSYTILDQDGNGYVFAGDNNKLYLLQAGSPLFENVSVGGSGAPYNGTEHDYWSGTAVDDFLVMTNFTDPIQVFQLGVSTEFADLSADAPRARYAKMVKEFLVVGDIHTTTTGTKPHWIWWSGAGQIDYWPEPGTNAAVMVQSDIQVLDIENGWVQGIVSGLGSADAAIFQERAIVRMSYTGDENIFQFDVAEGSRGTPAPRSIVQVGPLVYYLGENGFYVFNGIKSESIGEGMVDKYFFRNLNQEHYHSISGTFDPITKNVFWVYVSKNNLTNIPDRCIIYNYALGIWSEAVFNCEYLTQSLSIGYTLDQFDESLGWTLETMPFPFDSRVWTSGRLLLAGFNTDHRMCHFSGNSLPAKVETGEIHANNQRLAVTTTRPIVDGSGASISVGKRDFLSNSSTYTTPVNQNIEGYCPQRVGGKFIRLRLTMPQGASFSHIEGIETNIISIRSR